MKPLLISTALCLCSFAFGSAVVSGNLLLPKALTAQAKGIRTVFVSISDPKSQVPMPCAAQKFSLTSDANGTFLPFTLDTDSLTLMGCAALPEPMNLKAKLDKDGSAGRDSAGDIVGTATNVKKGATVTITLDRAL